MSGAITPLISNPTVAYKLDPGEPGVAAPARATSSVYTVVGQESRNRARLASEALLEGKDVLFVNTQYKVEQVGSFNVVVGGLTTVITRDRADKTSPLESPSGQASAPGDQTQQASDPVKAEQLSTEQKRLETERRDLKADKNSGDPEKAAEAKTRLSEIDQRLREIKIELRRLGVTSGAGSSLSPGAAFAANGFSAALDAVGQLLDLIG